MTLRTPAWLVAAAFAAGLSVSAPSQDPDPAPDAAELAVRVQELERQLGALRKERAALAEVGDKVAAMEAYLQRLGRAAEQSAAALDAAVEQGFTFGINPEAKESMVASVRGLADAARTKVPGVPEPQPEPPDPRRARFERER